MSPHTRLTVLIATLMTPTVLVGCGPMDDEACLTVDFEAECPSDEDARDQLVGTQTCEDPVRKVTRTGELISSEDVEGYDGTYGYVDAFTRCCYEAAYKEKIGESCVIGRPIRDGGEALVAPVESRTDWRDGPSGVAEVTTRHELADQWLADAQLEHASVAAFARLTLELLSLGAPAELVRRATEAQADEIRHAEQSFALASAYAGRALGPGDLPAPSTRAPDLVRLAVEAFEEGCVGETLATCRAAVQLRTETDPAVRAVLMGIVDDESRHAALAWDIVSWALAAGGQPVREALIAASEAVSLPVGGLAGVPEWELQEAFRQAVAEVIRPTADELLAA